MNRKLDALDGAYLAAAITGAAMAALLGWRSGVAEANALTPVPAGHLTAASAPAVGPVGRYGWQSDLEPLQRDL